MKTPEAFHLITITNGRSGLASSSAIHNGYSRIVFLLYSAYGTEE